jgi:radical SAM superfamily enzyme YgiQ (UPF0313 family)
MRIALISPRGELVKSNHAMREFVYGSEFGALYRRDLSGITPGLLVLAALTPSDIEVEVLDENVEEIDFDRSYDLIGITGMTQQAVRAYAIADEFKRRNVRVVIGGIHATQLPDEAKLHADSVVIGEGEYIWPAVLRDLAANTLQPFYRNSRPVDLKDSPIPRYDMMKHKTKNRVFWVQSTRGCPHDCEFCCASKVFGRTYRHKPVKAVIAEIAFIKSHCKSFHLHFSDDNLMGSPRYLRELLGQLAGMKVFWFGQSDVSVADHDDILALMQKSGCYCVFIGFDSLSEEGLKSIDASLWKSRYLPMYKSSISRIQSYGIGVQGAFIVGLENDTMETFDRIIDFIVESNMYQSQITIATPLPGTRLRKRLEQEGRLLATPWDNYTFSDVNFIHNNLTQQELEEGLLRVYKSIYAKEVFEKKLRHLKEIQKHLAFDSLK